QALRLLSQRVLVRSGEEQLGILIGNRIASLNPRTHRIGPRGIQLLLKSRDPVRRLLRLRLLRLLQVIALCSLLLEVVIVGELRPLPSDPVPQRRVQLFLAGNRLESAFCGLIAASLALLLTAFILSQLFLL